MAADEKVPGIELRHELRGHEGRVTSLSWSPDGRLLASAATDHTIRVWDLTADLEHRIIARYEGTGARVAWSPDGAILASSPYLGQVVRHSVATWSTLGSSEGAEQGTWLSWSPDGAYLASGQQDGSITFWTDEDDFSTPYSTFKIDDSAVHQVAWHPSQQLLASGSLRGDVQLWTWPSPLVTMLKGHSGQVYSVAWSPDGRELASASEDCTLRIWDESGTPLRTLEGHTNPVVATAFSPCGRLLASRGDDGVRLWRRDTWEALTHITEPASSWTGVMAFHPRLALLAVESGNDIHVWALDPDRLLEATPVTSSVSYTTAKVVLVGDSGVGKTGLGWRVAHGSFKEQASTHGQQFWVLDSLGATRDDGTECEAVLWDLAGQPDYRLIHALFLDDAELALVLFDPTEHSEPLRGADYWLKALATRPGGPGRSILVGARIDRGEPTLTDDQILAFCGDRASAGATSSRAQPLAWAWTT